MFVITVCVPTGRQNKSDIEGKMCSRQEEIAKTNENDSMEDE